MARSTSIARRLANRLRVRRATLRDLDALVHQRRAMWMDLGITDSARLDKADSDYRQWTRTRMKNHQLMAWVVDDREGRVAGGGCVWLHPIQPSPRWLSTVQPYLLSMYTEPEFRRRGVASMIVWEAIEWSREQGYGRLALHASEMGRGVYKKFGFTRGWEMRLNLENGSQKTGRSQTVHARRKVARS